MIIADIKLAELLTYTSLVVIQLTAFLKTLRRKNKITDTIWNISYSTFLLISS